jgi:hypothetical protein
MLSQIVLLWTTMKMGMTKTSTSKSQLFYKNATMTQFYSCWSQFSLNCFNNCQQCAFQAARVDNKIQNDNEQAVDNGFGFGVMGMAVQSEYNNWLRKSLTSQNKLFVPWQDFEVEISGRKPAKIYRFVERQGFREIPLLFMQGFVGKRGMHTSSWMYCTCSSHWPYLWMIWCWYHNSLPHNQPNDARSLQWRASTSNICFGCTWY